MNFIVSNQDISKDFHLYTVLIQVINSVSIVQLPNFHVFRKNMHYAGIKLLNTLLCRFTNLVNERLSLEQCKEDTSIHSSFSLV